MLLSTMADMSDTSSSAGESDNGMNGILDEDEDEVSVDATRSSSDTDLKAVLDVVKVRSAPLTPFLWSGVDFIVPGVLLTGSGKEKPVTCV